MGKIKSNEGNKNLRQQCFYYPCHSNISDEDYDCRMCYCPLYKECSEENNTLFGGYYLKARDKNNEGKQVWACEKCSFVHNKNIVEYYQLLKNRGLDNKEILLMLIKKYNEEYKGNTNL